MTIEAPPNNEGPSKENQGADCNLNSNDLTTASKQQTQNNDTVIINSPNKGPKSSRNGNSPTKSSNKKRNEVKRRKANQRKQPTGFKDDGPSTEGRDESKSVTVLSSPSPIPEKNVPQSVILGPDEDKNEARVSEDNNRQTSNHDQAKGSQRKQSEKDKSNEQKNLKEQLKVQNAMVQNLIDKLKNQANKARELESALLSTTKTCNQLNQILQQELTSRNKLEAENDSLNQTISRLRSQVSEHEKNKYQSDELVRVLNATLMERETEVSILKLKLTRLQTNPSSKLALNSNTSINSMRQDPCHAFATTGRSNSEFDRNSYIRSSMMAERANIISSNVHLKNDRDASIWATVPEELTPSKRPLLLEKNLQPIYNEPSFCQYDFIHSNHSEQSNHITRDRRYRTLPRSMKSPPHELNTKLPEVDRLNVAISNDDQSVCQVTNLDDSNSTNQSVGNNAINSSVEFKQQVSTDVASHHNSIDVEHISEKSREAAPEGVSVSKTGIQSLNEDDSSHYSTISKVAFNSRGNALNESESKVNDRAPSPAELPSTASSESPPTPIKLSSGLKKILGKFRRLGSSQSKTDLTSIVTTPTKSPFKRGGNRSTLVGAPADTRAHMSPLRQATNFQTDKPFAEWNTDMLVDWLTMIGLSMYTQQCRRWVRCGAHIMYATPAEVDKGLGITNHLHRKKLRLAISELNGDCDKITKAASKLDYLLVARWLDDIGLPQYKEAFIDARIDGRVLNYLTVDDLLSLGVKSVLHHASIKCGIKVLRSIEFDWLLLKRRATAGEIEQMNSTRQRLNQAADNLITTSSQRICDTDALKHTDVSLWTCHKVMEWLRMIDFAEFASNLRGSGVHGGLIVFEDGFNIDTMCLLLSIPSERTLLRRHLSTFFKDLIGEELAEKKREFQDCPNNPRLNPTAEIKTAKKSQWLNKFRSAKVAHDDMDDYLCPMYPVERQIIKSTPKKGVTKHEPVQLPKISESINV